MKKNQLVEKLPLSESFLDALNGSGIKSYQALFDHGDSLRKIEDLKRWELYLKGRKVTGITFKVDPKTAHIDLKVCQFNRHLQANRKQEKVIWIDEKGREHKIPISQMDKIRDQMPSLNDYVRDYQEIHPERDIIAAIPNGNVLWNDHFVSITDGTVYYRLEEPILERPYACLIIWNSSDVSMETIRFFPKNGRKEPYRIEAQGIDITEDIRCALSGQPVLQNGEPIDPGDIVHLFEDLRHPIGMPYLKGIPLSTDLLLEDLRKLKQAARGDIVELDLRELARESLQAGGYTEAKHGIREGEFMVSGGKVRIRYRSGIYPHFLMGVTEDQKVISILVEGKSGRKGITINEGAELLKEENATDGILICNGGDVTMDYHGERLVQSFIHRDHFSSVIIFARDKAWSERLRKVSIRSHQKVGI